jgi:hypothetical protein
MISSKIIIKDVKQVPDNWIFEYYLNLPERLHGQTVKIHSVFKNEKTPSMCLYADSATSKYKFKDFSSGNYGSAIDLVQTIFNLDFKDAAQRILDDYIRSLKSGYIGQTVKPKQSFQISEYSVRNWIQADADFWKEFGISRTLLEKYNVKPLSYYQMSNGDKVREFFPGRKITYGYFTKDDTIYKIYRPNTDKKFMKLAEYVQGLDQLQYDKDILVICSSLKDAMTLEAMNFKIEVIAPDSENSSLKPDLLNNLRSKYKKIITVFDNDDAGIAAMDKYRTEYGINGCFYPYAKDISDGVKQNGLSSVRNVMERIMLETINK